MLTLSSDMPCLSVDFEVEALTLPTHKGWYEQQTAWHFGQHLHMQTVLHIYGFSLSLVTMSNQPHLLLTASGQVGGSLPWTATKRRTQKV